MVPPDESVQQPHKHVFPNLVLEALVSRQRPRGMLNMIAMH